MGSFPSAAAKPEVNPAEAATTKPNAKKNDMMYFATEPNTVCYNYLKAMPLPRVLELDVGRRLFAAHCAEIKKRDVVHVYFALQAKWQALKQPSSSNNNNNSSHDSSGDELGFDLGRLEAAVASLASTTRLSNATIGLLRIGLNANGSFSNEDDLLNMMDDCMKALRLVEAEHWPRSSAGREFMGKMLKFELMLRDDMAMCFFHQFLVQEYSSENLEFVDTVNSFDDNYDTFSEDEQVAAAARILKLFVDENAPLQINIPSKIRVRLERKVIKDKEAPKDLFRAAKSEIVALVQRDSWPRFLKTPNWAAYLDYNEVAARTASAQARHDIYLDFIGDDDLSAILSHELGREYLGLYVAIMALKPEGSVDFLHRVTTYGMVQNEKEAEEMKHEIFARYLGPNAIAPARCVLPATIAAIAAQLETHKGPTLFDMAATQVRSYLEEQMVPQFKRNGMYAKYRVLVGQSQPIKRKGSLTQAVDKRPRPL
ncbi:hypothetical protein SPRG_02719 [Saprolegnia parasitica CBS 223.65]|uniref:RGS domain-containing protein n=1 Tax=Saprolegnia parasitica (strain CBS 223.65) TaxID=695850 RepID=A0A067D0G7_SAPPC|nr:hypothetical protein SPRG_02719 [Saprolegnia parasitica CBS 223.65]KDO32241.1 hypothetical protein SPRG_02719 [Saprolegnia parasitica CBS 223.65]|eukprot:XP_012196699.1 hypothetical protein SPRG_02719 [Saprolegnia parasitica CBS 223.65]